MDNSLILTPTAHMGKDSMFRVRTSMRLHPTCGRWAAKAASPHGVQAGSVCFLARHESLARLNGDVNRPGI